MFYKETATHSTSSPPHKRKSLSAVSFMVDNMQNGYSICFNEWALDKDIKNELGLLLIISSLCAKEGYCYADNEHLAEMFDVDNATISRKLKILEDKKYIRIEYKKFGNAVSERKIYLTRLTDYKNINGGLQKCQPTIGKNVNGNNNNINNNNINPPDNNIIINNNILSAPQKGTMAKPTLEELQAYIKEKGYSFDAESFIAYYDSNGWMIGKQKMKNWKAACVTWQRNGYGKKQAEEKKKEFYW